MNLWQRIKWNLFGETKAFAWMFALIVLANVLFYGGIIFVAIHFITKYW